MRYIILLLLAATVGLGVLAGQQAATIKEQQGQLAAASDRRKAELLAMQTQCANQAKLTYSELGYKPKDRAYYRNHFNSRLNKCMLYTESQPSDETGSWDNKALIDVAENNELGSLAWLRFPQSGKSEPPYLCHVQSDSAVRQSCKSDDEYEKLVKAYMEG